MPTSFWRSPRLVEQLDHLDRAGFAIEFLRRNSGYQQDYAHTLREIANGRVDADFARDALARRWGVHFCP